MTMQFDERMGNTEFGMGWWLFNLFYLSLFLLLPYLYSVDTKRWCR